MTSQITPSPQNSKHLTHPKYRPDIDGLRAIAILSVVGFHASPTKVTGGFIGVDIFFVISGYLISTIIIGNLERNSFNFVEFYIRRINRIFPALLLVLIVCLAFGWFVLLADEYKQLGKHIAGGAGFISNIILWSESGYFDNAAGTKPLLHLWSLGIEEQFYIAWPLLLFLAWKKRFNLLSVTVVVAVISFALNIGETNGGHANTAFYSPQTRFWELLTGSALAYLTLHKQNIFQKLKYWMDSRLRKIIYAHAPAAYSNILLNIQSVFGGILLAIGVFIFTKELKFPGWWAVLPTLGAVLIISAGSKTWFNRVVLSNRLLVQFGLISFPLYLWHWPLLSFARIVEGQPPSSKIRIAAVLISIALAWLTYRLIENPIRYGNHSKAKMITLLTLVAVVGYIGFNAFKRDGLPFRDAARQVIINDGDIGHVMFQKYLYEKFYLCTPNNILREAMGYGSELVRCFQSRENQPITIAIIGDSHAEHLFIGLAEALPRKNIAFYIKSSLPYVSNKDYEIIFNYVLEDKKITTVILSAYWVGKGGGHQELNCPKL